MAEDILGILDQAPPSPRPDRPAAEAASGAGSGAGAAAVVDSVLGAPTPAPAATPAVYKVQKGDTLASIAKAKLGKESLWTEIQRLNPAVKASTLKPDQVLKLPTAPAASPAKPALDEPLAMPADGAREYVVRKGDTFERIAVAQLGSRKRTDEIRALNPNTPPEKLRTGMTLKLPKK
jgi:LysM repeat protein